MKQKLSITVDEETIRLIERMVEGGMFRNKSHLLEYAVKIFLNNGRDKNG